MTPAEAAIAHYHLVRVHLEEILMVLELDGDGAGARYVKHAIRLLARAARAERAAAETPMG